MQDQDGEWEAFRKALAAQASEIDDLELACALAKPFRLGVSRINVLVSNAKHLVRFEAFIRVLFRRDEDNRAGPLLLLTSPDPKELQAIRRFIADVSGNGLQHRRNPYIGEPFSGIRRRSVEILAAERLKGAPPATSLTPLGEPRSAGFTQGVFFTTLPDHPWIYTRLQGVWRAFVMGEHLRTPRDQRFFFHCLIAIEPITKGKDGDGQMMNRMAFTWSGIEEAPYRGILGAALETLYFVRSPGDRPDYSDDAYSECAMVWDIASLLESHFEANILGVITEINRDPPNFPAKVMARAVPGSHLWSPSDVTDFVTKEGDALGVMNARRAANAYAELIGPLTSLPEQPGLADDPFQDEW